MIVEHMSWVEIAVIIVALIHGIAIVWAACVCTDVYIAALDSEKEYLD